MCRVRKKDRQSLRGREPAPAPTKSVSKACPSMLGCRNAPAGNATGISPKRTMGLRRAATGSADDAGLARQDMRARSAASAKAPRISRSARSSGRRRIRTRSAPAPVHVNAMSALSPAARRPASLSRIGAINAVSSGSNIRHSRRSTSRCDPRSAKPNNIRLPTLFAANVARRRVPGGADIVAPTATSPNPDRASAATIRDRFHSAVKPPSRCCRAQPPQRPKCLQGRHGARRTRLQERGQAWLRLSRWARPAHDRRGQ